MKIINVDHRPRVKFSSVVICAESELDDVANQFAAAIGDVVKATVTSVCAWATVTPCGLSAWTIAFTWKGKDLTLARILLPEQHISTIAQYNAQLCCYFEKKWNPYGGGRPGQWYATTKGHHPVSVCGKFRKDTEKETEVITFDLDKGFAPAVEIDDPWLVLNGNLPERKIVVRRDEGQTSYWIKCQGSELTACVSAREQWICGVGTTGKIAVRVDVKDWNGKCHHRTELTYDSLI